MIRWQGSRRIPPEVPIHFAQPWRLHQFEQFLDSIDRLAELPVADSAYSAKIREVPVNVGRAVLQEAPLGVGLDVGLGPDRVPPVHRWLYSLPKSNPYMRMNRISILLPNFPYKVH